MNDFDAFVVVTPERTTVSVSQGDPDQFEIHSVRELEAWLELNTEPRP